MKKHNYDAWSVRSSTQCKSNQPGSVQSVDILITKGAPRGLCRTFDSPRVAAALHRASIDENPNRQPPKHTNGIPSMDEYESLSHTSSFGTFAVKQARM
jgi:hypothetical protein